MLMHNQRYQFIRKTRFFKLCQFSKCV